MPGRDVPRSLLERLVYQAKASGFQTLSGHGNNASPMLSKSRVSAATRGRTAAGSAVVQGRLSHIQSWTVADTATTTFDLDFQPVPESWNVKLNGVGVHA